MIASEYPRSTRLARSCESFRRADRGGRGGATALTRIAILVGRWLSAEERWRDLREELHLQREERGWKTKLVTKEVDEEGKQGLQNIKRGEV